MKKSKKVSARTSYNMLPDYPYAVEVTGDSDGRRQKVQYVKPESIGASARFDSETNSEDSSSLKRKSINLNSAANKMDALKVPTYVIEVSQMSRSEKMELRKKLKLELDQVRSMAHRIEELQLTSSGSVPTVSDGHISRLANSCPGGLPGKSIIGQGAVQASLLCQKDGAFRRQSSFASDGSKGVLRSLSKDKRTPKVNQLYLNSEYVSGNDKMPQKSKVGAIGVKRGLLGRFEPKDVKRQKMDSVQRKTVAEYMNQCADTLKKLRTHKFAWAFNKPVDPVELNIPDYFQIITRPMDLGTVQGRLDNEYYTTPMEFAEDVRLTFANAMKYNPPGNDFHYMAVSLSQFFEGKWKIIEQKLAGEEVYRKLTQDVQLIPTKKQQCNNKITETRNKPKAQPPNSAPLSDAPSQQKPKVEKCKHPMSFNEKKKLSQDLEQLPDEMPVPIITFLRKHTGLSQNEEEIEVDIDAFDDDSLWELQNLVSNCLKEIGEGTRNAQAPAGLPNPEPMNARVGSQLESQPTKVAQQGAGGDPGDEYVDVGGDEMPATNFPSIDIEKDTAAVSIKCSSSSSSSSDSGSSSSDSDSGSSSGSESDADEAHSTDAPLKESVESGADCEERGNSDPETTGAKRAVSVLDEENAQPKATVSETDTHQEGESAPPERQVSPDKQIRAALLRSRFAETILKAQEKTFNQGNKGDPEKLRREREQLEKWQREEKARIQAEAKAAEAVRMKAEAEAAAEAKRKREMEREAARLELQKMERTVEIDENNQILEDLERLRYPPAEHTPSSGDETSPVQSEDVMKAFPLQGGNPLEQLGLTLKLDEEVDEEEGTTADCAAGNGDVEEGENGDVEEGEID